MMPLEPQIDLSAATVSRIVAETIPTLPDGHTNAIIGTVDTTGAEVVAHFALSPSSKSWELDNDAIAYHEWGGNSGIADKLILSW